MEQLTARCWAEIDLDLVRHNYHTACRECPGARVIPVLKADAYGLGAAKVAKALTEAGVTLFAVAEYLEAVEVRQQSGQDVLVMGYTHPAFYEDAVEKGIVLTMPDLESARLLNEAAEKRGKTARIHVKVDTGLHRLGFDPETAVGAISEIAAMPFLRIEGLFTHLALRGEESDEKQMAYLLGIAGELRRRNVDYGMLHALDSIGMLLYPQYRLDAVRAGAWIYGSANRHFPHPERCPLPVKVCARIAQVRKVAKGECLGYDDEHPLPRDSVIATVACGYYDGIPRANNKGFAVVRGQRVPIAGLVMMDQMTLDVTDVPGAQAGDAVTFLGDGISLLEASQWYGWNRNELIARMSRRVQKIYKDEKQYLTAPEESV